VPPSSSAGPRAEPFHEKNSIGPATSFPSGTGTLASSQGAAAADLPAFPPLPRPPPTRRGKGAPLLPSQQCEPRRALSRTQVIAAQSKPAERRGRRAKGLKRVVAPATPAWPPANGVSPSISPGG